LRYTELSKINNAHGLIIDLWQEPHEWWQKGCHTILPNVATGMVTRYAELSVTDIRVDSAFHAGSMVGVYYDSMLAKVICFLNFTDKGLN